jgi:UDP:flavonoid glycosyltransferase YjiC (YdhE family)
MPDLLLIDLELHYVVIASAELGIPTAVIEGWYGIFERPGLPPTHTDIIPDGTAHTQSRIQQAWAELRQAKRRQRIRRRFSPSRLRTAGRPVRYQTMDLEELKAVARMHGFDFKREIDLDAWPIPMAYRRLPVLSCCAWELEFPHDPHPLMRYLGPLVQSERKETNVSPQSMALWDDFQFKRRVEGKPERPLLYCSLGTYWAADLEFLKRIVMVLERHPEWDLVLGLGSKVDPAQLSALPANVLALDFAPQLAVLKKALCMITHGGSTTLNECIHFGVPMLMYSTGHGDQNGNAARVVYHGLGLLGDRVQDDATAIENRLLRILSDAGLRHEVDKMRTRFKAYETDGTAVRLIEQLMSVPAGTQTDPV